VEVGDALVLAVVVVVVHADSGRCRRKNPSASAIRSHMYHGVVTAGMPRIEADALRAFARRLLESADVPSDVAEQVAESLVRADEVGHGSHGVHRVPWYVQRIEDGGIDPGATPAVVRETPTTAVLDGQFGFGQVVGRHAVDRLVERAGECGVAAVGVRNGSHLGRIGEWAERTAAEDLLFFSFVNSQGQGGQVAPPGSAQRRLGTHPLTFGVPTFDALDFPVVMDMATSQVAHGKIGERAAAGEAIPEGWTVDADGEPVTDPDVYEDGIGALRPLGGAVSGYKGFGLAVVAELVAGLLGGGPTFGVETDDPWSNGAAFLAVDPTRLLPPEEARRRVAAVAGYLHATERSPNVSDGVAAKGDDETLLPGEAEHRARVAARADGVSLSAGGFDRLAALARERGLADAVPEPL